MKGSPSLLLVSRLGAAALAFGSAPIVARAIGPAGRGETGAAVALFGLIPVLIGFGLPQESRRLLAMDPDARVMATARKFVAWAFVPACLCAYLASMTIFSAYDAPARIVASAGVALAPLILSWMVDVSVLVVKKDYVGIALLQLIQPTVYLATVLLLWTLDLASTATVIGAYLVGAVATSAVGFGRVGRLGGHKTLPLSKLLLGSSRFAGGALAETATNRLDQVVALPVLGAVGAGFFSVGVTVAMAPLAISQALAAAAFTDIAESSGSDRQEVVDRGMRQVSSLSFLVAVLVVCFGPGLIEIVFGAEFQPAGIGVQIVSIACYFASVSYLASNVLIAAGMGVALTLSQLVAVVVGVVLLLVLGPQLGVAGAAIASAISYAVLAYCTVKASGAAWVSLVPTIGGVRTGFAALFRRG